MKEIIDKWLGKRVDYDGSFGYQCVDWVRQFAKEAFEPIGTFSGSAYNGWKTGSPFGNRWLRVKYEKGLFPTPGSIVFFGKTKGNPYGHTAVAENCTKVNLVIIEQNAGSGNGDGKGGNSIKKTTTTYANCLGWYMYQTDSQMAVKEGFWNGERPKDTPTRNEVAKMVSRASKKSEESIWNNQKGNDKATTTEMQIMSTRAFGVAFNGNTREELAGFCYRHKK